MKKEECIEVLTTLLKSEGYIKKATTWYKKMPDVTFVIDVQTSQWCKEDYYINLGIAIHAYNKKELPKEWECNIRERFTVKGNEKNPDPHKALERAFEFFLNNNSFAKIMENCKKRVLYRHNFSGAEIQEYLKRDGIWWSSSKKY